MDSLPQVTLDRSASRASGISIRNLTVRYEQAEPTLRNLNLDILPGEVLGLVGASGCGKSTLLRAIAGLTQPTTGDIDVQHRASGNRASGTGHATSNLAYVFQDATLLPWRTVAENVRLPLELQRLREPASVERDAVTEALRAVGLESRHWSKYPRALSGGMRMRTSIARALVTDPDVLLLDEPFAALDDLLRTRLNELILQLWHQRPRTIVFVTHNIAEAVIMSHRVAVVGGHRVARIMDNTVPWPRGTEQRGSVGFARQYSAISKALGEVAVG